VADAAVSVLDSAGVARPVDAQLVGTDYQQTVTIGDGTNTGRVMLLLADGSAMVGTNVSSTANRTSVTSAITDAVVLAANASRRGFTIYNESTSVMRIGFGTVATSATSYSVQIPANSSYVGDVPLYTGQIRGHWVTANGAARVTEFTA
jgi:hypothetical protein